MKKLNQYKSVFKETTAFKKNMEYKSKGQKFILNLGLSKTNNTYFSFTMDVFEKGRDVGGGGGASHETMIKIMPELKKYIDLHLASDKGVPMYSVENGYYYLQNPSEYNTDVVASHFRISNSEASKLQKGVKSGEMTKEDIISFVESQKKRWAKEAQNAIKWIKGLDDSKIYETNVKW